MARLKRLCPPGLVGRIRCGFLVSILMRRRGRVITIFGIMMRTWGGMCRVILLACGEGEYLFLRIK